MSEDKTKLVNFAAANSIRKKIINSLADGEKNTEQIKRIVDGKTLDFHLNLLQQANLVEIEEERVKLSDYGKKFLKDKTEKNKDKIPDLSDARPVEIVEIRQLLPCIADSSKFRAIANMEPPLGRVLKILEPIFLRANYSDTKQSLIIKKGEIITTVYGSGKVSMRMIKNENEAKMELERIKSIINETVAKGIVPAPKEKIKVELLDIYRLLPQTNCGKCNEQGCYSFAIKLMAGETTLERCATLKEEKYAENQESLEILTVYI